VLCAKVCRRSVCEAGDGRRSNSIDNTCDRRRAVTSFRVQSLEKMSQRKVSVFLEIDLSNFIPVQDSLCAIQTRACPVDTMPFCSRQTQGHGIYRASMASRGKTVKKVLSNSQTELDTQPLSTIHQKTLVHSRLKFS